MSTALKKASHPPASSAPEELPFWKKVVEIGEELPDREWKQVPPDASAQLRHYLYGAPKKR